MPCSRYARHTPAVPSGRRVSERPPWSSKVNISFCTMSVVSPTPRANRSVASKIGVSMKPKPACPNSSSQRERSLERRLPSSGSTSKVPRGAWSLPPPATSAGELGEEGVARALRAERGESHVAGVNGGVLVQVVHERADRLEQGRPVAAGQVGAADGALEQHVSREHDLFVRDREGHVARAVARGEDHVDLEVRQLELLAAA